ncbi:MAG TPA: M1 family metallopeptidase, partial [Vicinamibacterales bacterium]|nr:M1 family metallopeptidase [Vicinamibacterales bacterium]
FYFLGQWFPKIGVLEEAGWNCHQFHATTEFFSDFGIYDVQLTVPAGWIVGATGVEQGRRDAGNGRTTHRYYAADVHDFAWTTSPDYVERTETFTHPTLPPVVMRLLLQPEHVSQADRHFAATRATLRHYGDWFGPYPYPQLTIVDPAWQSGADGMEYPTLITAGTRWLAPIAQGEPEGVTIHEAGHQFWYGVVANNEFEHAWMDEGVNTYATSRTLAQSATPLFFAKRYFGDFLPWTLRAAPLHLPEDGSGLAAYAAMPHGDTPATPSYRYWPETAGLVTYSKTGLWLATLERLVGWDTMQRIMSTFYSRFAFRHPKPEDFFAVVNEISGRDFTWFFDRVYRSSVAFDYAVDVFTSRRRVVNGPDRARDTLRPLDDSTAFHTQVVVRRLEDGTFPVDVRVRFENGGDVRWRWDGESRWKAFETDTSSRAVSVQVDPERVLLLDRNYTNNSATLTADASGRAARKWSLTWLVWLQDQLLTYGFFV